MFNFFRRKKEQAPKPVEEQRPQPVAQPIPPPAPPIEAARPTVATPPPVVEQPRQPESPPLTPAEQIRQYRPPSPAPVVEQPRQFVAPPPVSAPVIEQPRQVAVPAPAVRPYIEEAPEPTPEQQVDEHYQNRQEIRQYTDDGLEKTRSGIFGRIGQLFEVDDITDEFWDNLLELLLQADIGYNLSEKLIENMQRRTLDENIKRGKMAQQIFRQEMIRALREAQARAIGYVTEQQKKLHRQREYDQQQREREQRQRDKKNKNQPVQPIIAPPPPDQSAADGQKRPYVILIVGVNGNGKTTSIAKLATYYKNSGASVVLGACDTFRAGAINQLKLWGEKIDVPVVAREQGADPASVAFDTIKYAQEHGTDLVIIDTAGRMQSNSGLMEELKKVERIIERAQPGAPDEVNLVLEAVTGQNGLSQAKEFSKLLGIDGIILTKLDSTAKGGIAFAIANELKIPIKYIGTGERASDLAEFDPEAYVNALFRR